MLLISTGEPSGVNLAKHASNFLRHMTNFAMAISPYFESLSIHLRWVWNISGYSCINMLFHRYFTRGSEKKSSLFLAQFSLKVLRSSSLASMHSVGKIFFIEQGKRIVKSFRVLSWSSSSWGKLKSVMKTSTF